LALSPANPGSVEFAHALPAPAEAPKPSDRVFPIDQLADQRGKGPVRDTRDKRTLAHAGFGAQ